MALTFTPEEKIFQFVLRALRNAPSLLFLTLGLVGYLLPSMDYFRSVPGDLADARFNCAILEHLHLWITGIENHLWSPPFFYPYENTLAFSDNHFGSALFYLLWRFGGTPKEIAFDCWILTGVLLNFLAARYTLRTLSVGEWGAAAGAFVFSFALPVLAQEGHAQLGYRFAIPLAFLAWLRVLSTRRAFWLGMTATWLSIEFLCSIYLGVFLCYLLAASTLVWVVLPGAPSRDAVLANLEQHGIAKRATASACVLGAAGLLATLLLLIKYQHVSAHYHFARTPDEILSMLPQPSSYLLADRAAWSSWVGQIVGDIPMRHERQMFFGIVVSIFIAWSIALTPSRRGAPYLLRFCLLTLALLALGTMQIDGKSLYDVVVGLPGFNAIRAVTRIVLVMTLPVAVLVALMVDRIDTAMRGQRLIMRASAVVVLALAIGAEVLVREPYTTPISAWRDRLAAARTAVAGKLVTDSLLYVMRADFKPFSYTELDGMMLAQEFHLPTLNGYSGNQPPGYDFADPCISMQNRLRVYVDFEHLPVSLANSLATRVVVVSLAPCPHEPIIAQPGPSPEDLAKVVKDLRLSIRSLQREHGLLRAEIAMTNTGNIPLSTLYTAGPLRLSWRLVPLAPESALRASVGWDTRQGVIDIIRPGETVAIAIKIALPSDSTQRLLQASMVLDGVAWLHHLGMPIAEASIPGAAPGIE